VEVCAHALALTREQRLNFFSTFCFFRYASMLLRSPAKTPRSFISTAAFKSTMMA
jgi:hypothetical protein